MPNVSRKTPSENHTQSVIFSKERWTKAKSRQWCVDNDYFVDGYDETATSHRWRQYNPDEERFRYRNKDIGEGKTLVNAFAVASARASAAPMHLLERVVNVPLMVKPEIIGPIISVLTSPHHNALSFEVEASMEATRPERRRYELTDDGTAIIGVSGKLVHRALQMKPLSGPVTRSYESIGADIDSALEDEEAKRILMVFDSPGGEVAGSYDLADKIYRARAVKPIYGLAEDMAASAGYLLLSACEKAFITQSAVVGSIGVVFVHADRSQANDKVGVRYTEIVAGARKTDGSPNRPLDDDGLLSLQTVVNQYYELFVAKVATFRGLDPGRIRATEARIFIGESADEHGLIDGVTTFNALIEQMGGTMDPEKVKGQEDQGNEEETEEERRKREEEEEGMQEKETVKATAAITADSRASILAEGIAAERTRMTAIDTLTISGHETLATKAKAEGWSKERFMEAQTLAEQGKSRAYLDAQNEDGEKTAPHAAAPQTGDATVTPSVDLPIEEQAKAVWDGNPAIRKAHEPVGGYKAFLAGFKKNRKLATKVN